jgi:hypothetical protein
MATDDDGKRDDESPEERHKRMLELTSQVADRYDPDHLSKISVEQAGRSERLDLTTQSEMERRIGGKFGDVRIIRGAVAEAVTKQHRADAVTIGRSNMILVREGPRSDPNTALGKALIAHELTHVHQSQRGMHFDHTLASEGNPNDHLEQGAEAVENQVHAEETGAAPGQSQRGPGKKKEDPEAKKQRVLERVRALAEEHERIRRDRSGLD